MAESELLTPEPIFRGLTAFWLSAAMRTGIELGLFAALVEGPLDAAALGARIQCPARSTAMLADALVGTGVLSKADGRYGLTPVAETFLDPKKPSYLGSMVHIVSGAEQWASFADLASAVRKGGCVMEQGHLTPDDPFWHTFAQSSLAMAMGQGQQVAELAAAKGIPVTRVLDIAAGTGGYGCAFGMKFPEAKVAFADWPGVLGFTKQNADRFGLGARAEFRPGDIFTSDWGSGYDLVLLPNIYHHFDEADCLKLSARVREALKPGGAAVVVDFVPDDAREAAAMPLLFALVMLTHTPKGTTYTGADYRRFLGQNGFTRFDAVPLAGPQTAIFAW